MLIGRILTYENMMKIAMDVCGGMLFLTGHKIIHRCDFLCIYVTRRDLAARNVLCKREGESFVGKVSDFGLSRYIAIEALNELSKIDREQLL